MPSFLPIQSWSGDVERGPRGVLALEVAERLAQERLDAPRVAGQDDGPGRLDRLLRALGALVVPDDGRALADPRDAVPDEPDLQRVAVLARRHRGRPGVAEAQADDLRLQPGGRRRLPRAGRRSLRPGPAVERRRRPRTPAAVIQSLRFMGLSPVGGKRSTPGTPAWSMMARPPGGGSRERVAHPEDDLLASAGASLAQAVVPRERPRLRPVDDRAPLRGRALPDRPPPLRPGRPLPATRCGRSCPPRPRAGGRSAPSRRS